MNQSRSTTAATQETQAKVPRVSVQGLTKKYKTRTREHVALHEVSLDIGAEEFVVLLGPSGCGKTTLLRSIAGLEQPESGEILLDGEPVSSARSGIWVPPESRRLGMVFQSYALWPHMSVFENVAYPLRNAGVGTGEIAPRVQQALERVGLETLAASSPGQLSGGQQQRVALARALVSTSGLVLFDEPLSNLDAKVRERLRLELARLQRSLGFAALYVTHDQGEALALADRIAVMEAGRIAQVGTPEEIYNSPATRYVADFIGSANEVQGTVESFNASECVVTTPLGRLVGRARTGVSRSGQKVAVMFRPEHCKVIAKANPAPAEHNRIEGVLERSVFQGATQEHVLRAGEHLVVALALSEEVVPSATQAAVTVPVARTMVYGLEDETS
jgi:iron(III) transport system ATP-binding protein